MTSLRDQIVDETTRLADAIKTAPGARVRKYPSWDLAQLGRHVGETHGWVTGILTTRATERPSRSKLDHVAASDVPGVLHIGAVALADALEDTPPDTAVWGFAGDGTAAFWRRRMLLETTIHRWDAQDALGSVTPVPHDLALDGIDECLDIYCGPGLPQWELHRDGTAIDASCEDGSCRVEGGVVDLWLLAMGRRRLDGLDVSGDRDLATRLVDDLRAMRGPAG